ncbi:MAG TPA: LLM class flavin-dependent oxidoreductase [Candidatus Limnocylindria bacterium]|jgi:probable F420-dependent oxidoreductase|nr:LLM class flavin-dependent oxidoreductase [Candidatus Limnocylindria bacterium]
MKIGLMLPIGEQEKTRRTLPWHELRGMALAAEDSGLDSIWAADHLIFHDDGTWSGIHECWTLLTAVAAITERVEIGPLVLALPFRNPALTAKMAAALDEVSGGRLILGVGCGWHEPEFDAFDFPFDHRVGRFEEALRVLLPLLRDGQVKAYGRWHRADAKLLPPAPRPNGPPILIAGKRPRMLRLVARHADAWNAAWYGRRDEAAELEQRIALLREACAAEGRDLSTITLTAGLFVHFPGLPDSGYEDPPTHSISGSAGEVGRELAAYRELGIEHLIVHLWPPTAAAVAELGRAAGVARADARIAAHG